MFKKVLLCSFITSSIFIQAANACTRAVYLGSNDHIITARTMDWKSDVGTNFYMNLEMQKM